MALMKAPISRIIFSPRGRNVLRWVGVTVLWKRPRSNGWLTPVFIQAHSVEPFGLNNSGLFSGSLHASGVNHNGEVETTG